MNYEISLVISCFIPTYSPFTLNTAQILAYRVAIFENYLPLYFFIIFTF